MTDWERDGIDFGWVMPTAPLWKRLPVIRHVRAMYLTIQVSRHNQFWLAMGAVPNGYDAWVLHGIFIGKERPQ